MAGLKKRSHMQKSHFKMINARDLPGNAKGQQDYNLGGGGEGGIMYTPFLCKVKNFARNFEY